MKHLLIAVVALTPLSFTHAQSEIDLTGKTFQQVDKLPSTTEMYFSSNSQVTYIITSVVFGKTYVDKCKGKATVNGNKISIICNCDDKELYPDPIEDSFIYNPKTKSLTSTRNRTTDGQYFVWNLK